MQGYRVIYAVGDISMWLGAFILFSLFSLKTVAKDYWVLGSDQTEENGEQLIQIRLHAKSGDVIHFPNGKSFTILERIDASSTTIYRINYEGTPAILRVAIAGSLGHPEFGSNVRSYVEQHETLRDRARVPELYDSYGELYEVMEAIDVGTTLGQYLVQRERWSPSDRALRDQALMEFARATAQFSMIGDFGFGQLVFDRARSRWVLLDWNRNSTLIHRQSPIADVTETGLFSRIRDVDWPVETRGLARRARLEMLRARMELDLNHDQKEALKDQIAELVQEHQRLSSAPKGLLRPSRSRNGGCGWLSRLAGQLFEVWTR